MADAEVLWHVLKPVTAKVMAAAPKLKLIQKLGVGVNTIDLEAARARGIAVANMPGTNSAAVAEMALSLMLAVLRRTVYFDELTRSGEGWTPDAAVLDQTGEIGGRTVGLVGFGEPARRTSRRCWRPWARVWSTTGQVTERRRTGSCRWRICWPCGATSSRLHAPLTDETAGMGSTPAPWRG